MSARGKKKLSEGEAAQLRKGLCSWQTGTGLPWTTYCTNATTAEPFCAEHEQDCRELYPPR